MRFRLPPIYPITDKVLSRKRSHLAILRELVRGGATLVQIRDKQTPIREFLLDLQRCVEFADKHGVLLIVNDRCDLALSCKAAGVHLGQDDLPPRAARALLGPCRIIGVSTHSSAQVAQSQELPVNYLGFGPIYATSTKQSPYAVKGVRSLRRTCDRSSKPVVAIGGIGLEQIEEVLGAGASSAAVISSLMCTDDLARRMEAFLHAAMEIG
jgi:thiamine-phosphate pyrophosphorylase